jgi:hypothetical protein
MHVYVPQATSQPLTPLISEVENLVLFDKEATKYELSHEIIFSNSPGIFFGETEFSTSFAI